MKDMSWMAVVEIRAGLASQMGSGREPSLVAEVCYHVLGQATVDPPLKDPPR